MQDFPGFGRHDGVILRKGGSDVFGCMIEEDMMSYWSQQTAEASLILAPLCFSFRQKKTCMLSRKERLRFEDCVMSFAGE